MRNTQHIKRDMLEWAKHHLYARSTDEWSYETLEADPLVHLLIGACASEAKEVYEAIHETEDRLLQRVLGYLLPESFQMPMPAVAVAQAQARTPTCTIPATQSLVFREGETAMSFTPLFDTTLINGTVRFIGTDTQIIEKSAQPQHIINNKPEEITKLLIGIETPQPVKSLENVAFFVDWIGDEIEKRQFLLALAQSQWTWNEHILQKQSGFLGSQAAHWQDHFDAEKQLSQRINAQYKQHFHLITDAVTPIPLEMNVVDVLRAWLNKNPQSADEEKNTTERWTHIKGHFIWLRIRLPYGVVLTDIQRKLIFTLNRFIVVNRKLLEKDDNDTYFSRSAGIEAVTIQPKSGFFLGIRDVYNQISNKPIPAMPLAQLIKEKNQTVYSFRWGGVGRADSYNTWERLSYLLSVLRQEHKQRELADKLGDKMSLEELHEAVGERISKTESKQADNATGQQMPVYLFVQPGESSYQLRIKIAYWITDGEAANNLNEGTKLSCEPVLAGMDPLSVSLVTRTRGGKNKYTATEQITALQDTLLRRGRIVSAQDVKSLCRLRMGEALKGVALRAYFETDRTHEGGVRRAVEVTLTVTKPEDTFIQQLAQEIELTLQENSVGTMPYKVVLEGRGEKN